MGLKSHSRQLWFRARHEHAKGNRRKCHARADAEEQGQVRRCRGSQYDKSGDLNHEREDPGHGR